MSKHTKENPFKVPEDYFETLSDRVQERIASEDKPEKTPTLELIKPYLWMVASVAGLAMLAKMILPSIINPEYKIQKLSQADTQVVETEIPSTLNDSDYLFSSNSETSTDEIIEYLSDEEIDPELLIANL